MPARLRLRIVSRRRFSLGRGSALTLLDSSVHRPSAVFPKISAWARGQCVARLTPLDIVGVSKSTSRYIPGVVASQVRQRDTWLPSKANTASNKLGQAV